jgi:hypothetical protein
VVIRYIIGSGSALGEVVRYVSHTQHGTTTGNIKAMSLWLGQGVGLADSIQCAAEIVRKIRDEANTVLRRIDTSHTVEYCLPLADSDCRHLALECRLSASYSGIADEAEENAKARVLSYYDIEEKIEQILTQLSARPWDEETVVETGG